MTVTTYETPQPFFDMLNAEFKFTLDVCALPGTAKCSKFFTPEIDGLQQDWSKDIFWMNPPYGRGQDVYSWVKKAYETTRQGGTGAGLLPASVDTKWFHDFVMKSSEVRFVKDRLWFALDGVEKRSNHKSMVVVFKPAPALPPKISTIPNCRAIKKAMSLKA